MMDDEFDKLIAIFSEGPKEKEKKMEEIFQRSSQFFDQFKHVLAAGTEEEKAEMKKKMEIFKAKIREERVNNQDDMEVSAEKIKGLTQDRRNFTKEQWEFLQTAEARVVQEKAEIEKKLEEKREKRKEELRGMKRKKGTARKSSWMKT